MAIRHDSLRRECEALGAVHKGWSKSTWGYDTLILGDRMLRSFAGEGTNSELSEITLFLRRAGYSQVDLDGWEQNNRYENNCPLYRMVSGLLGSRDICDEDASGRALELRFEMEQRGRNSKGLRPIYASVVVAVSGGTDLKAVKYGNSHCYVRLEDKQGMLTGYLRGEVLPGVLLDWTWDELGF